MFSSLKPPRAARTSQHRHCVLRVWRKELQACDLYTGRTCTIRYGINSNNGFDLFRTFLETDVLMKPGELFFVFSICV